MSELRIAMDEAADHKGMPGTLGKHPIVGVLGIDEA